MNSIERVVVEMLRGKGVFYASLLSQMKRIEDERIGTAGVTVQNGRLIMYWNPKFFEGLSDGEQHAVLEHECLHLVYLHLLRVGDRNPRIWNIAADIAINQKLEGLPKDHMGLNSFPGLSLPPEEMAEVYYSLINKEMSKYKITQSPCPVHGQPGQQGKDPGDKGQGQEGKGKGKEEGKGGKGKGKGKGEGQGEGSGEGSGDGQSQSPQHQHGGKGQCTCGTITIEGPDGSKTTIRPVDNHKPWEDKDQNGTGGELGELEREVVKQAIKEAWESSTAQGHAPGHLSQAIQDLLRPPTIPWYVILKRYVGNSVKGHFKYTWKRPNRRINSEDVKGKARSRKLKLVAAIDTSGSVGDEELQQFIAELRGIQHAYKCEFTMIECDATVQKVYKLPAMGPIKIECAGRGGTAFEPVFEYVAQKRLAPDILVYMTDLYGSFPKQPPYPTVWVQTPDSGVKDVPFGRMLKIEAAKKGSTRDGY